MGNETDNQQDAYERRQQQEKLLITATILAHGMLTGGRIKFSEITDQSVSLAKDIYNKLAQG